jgi:hypothetical protein
LIWAAYECGNPDSEFYKSLLNIRRNGDRQSSVTWRGCEYGGRREK